MGHISYISYMYIAVLGHLATSAISSSSKVHLWSDTVERLVRRKDNTSAALQVLEDSRARTAAPCNKTSLSDLGIFPGNQTTHLFQKQARVAVRTAIFLTALSVRVQNDTELVYGEDLYHYLSRMNVLSESHVLGSGIVVSRESSVFSVYAYKGKGGRQQDVRFEKDYSYDADSMDKSGWFQKLSLGNYSEVLSRWRLKGSPGDADSFQPDLSVDHGVWTSPFWDCDAIDSWVITFAVPFFSLQSANSLKFRGAVTVNIDLSSIDINQCANDGSLFAGSHKCNLSSMVCDPTPGKGFVRGSYRCRCEEGFYLPFHLERWLDAENDSAVSGAFLEEQFAANQSALDRLRCLPCPPGCATCELGQPCFVEYNMVLRSLALGIQSFCTTITLVLMVVVFRLRKSKMFATAMWVLLEIILAGALFLYQTIIVRYFEPTITTCLIEPWFREIGFIVLFGALMLKIYRILAEFQTRKAHRVCVRDKDLMKYLLGFVLVVIGYMAAWTAVIMDNLEEGQSILEEAVTPTGLRYVACRALWWDYVTEMGEVLFLFLGIYLTYCIRNARVECYKEKWTLCFSVYIETIFSLGMYIVRHILATVLEPDIMFLMYFIRCHLTVSLILLLIFAPKLWYHHRPPNHSAEHRGRHFSSYEIPEQHPESLKLHEAIVSNGEVDIADINLADMDPEDIRAELRRVYTQLQILRNKTMRKDNPHISKRRGGRKVTHRRFSLQPFHHKHKHHHDHEHETTEVSKTPEESTASVEGTTILQPDGPSVTSTSALGHENAPSATATPSKRS